MGNPYQHYNTESTGCYQRLWELEGGDGNDVGYNYAGGNHPPDEDDISDDGFDDDDPALNIIDEEPLAAIEPEPEPVADEGHQGGRGDPQVEQNDGPLVFRLAPVPPRPAPAPVPGPARARPGQGQANPQPANGRLGGRFGRAAARRAAAEAEEAERRLEARNAAWNRRMGRDAAPAHGGPDA